MIKVMLVFGTRPEAIKMCPLFKELQLRRDIQPLICVTGQHGLLLEQVLTVFQIAPDYDLKIMKAQQSLFDITVEVLNKLKDIMEKEKPDVVLVHGDTTTAFAAALACYYLQIRVGHIEAGLRTGNIYSPFPEEFNRQAVGLVAQYHFSPTESAAENLLREGKNPEYIFVTGNTVIDSLKYTIVKDYRHEELDWIGNHQMVLVTAHRRENIGEPMEAMFTAIRRICREYSNIRIIFPIHMNPRVRETAFRIFQKEMEEERIHLIEPLSVYDFHNLLYRCHMVLTDSGGIQEEAAALGKPVLVMREKTERVEGTNGGTLRLVGTDSTSIYEEFKNLLTNPDEYAKRCIPSAIYGDGLASVRIADILEGKKNPQILPFL